MQSKYKRYLKKSTNHPSQYSLNFNIAMTFHKR